MSDSVTVARSIFYLHLLAAANNLPVLQSPILNRHSHTHAHSASATSLLSIYDYLYVMCLGGVCKLRRTWVIFCLNEHCGSNGSWLRFTCLSQKSQVFSVSISPKKNIRLSFFYEMCFLRWIWHA